MNSGESQGVGVLNRALSIEHGWCVCVCVCLVCPSGEPRPCADRSRSTMRQARALMSTTAAVAAMLAVCAGVAPLAAATALPPASGTQGGIENVDFMISNLNPGKAWRLWRW